MQANGQVGEVRGGNQAERLAGRRELYFSVSTTDYAYLRNRAYEEAQSLAAVVRRIISEARHADRVAARH